MRTLLLLAVAAALSGCALTNIGSGVKGSGKLVKKTLSVSSFSKIEHDTVGEVVVKVGGPMSVEVETDDNILDLLKTDVTGETLKLDNKENISPSKLVYTITVPSLTSFALEGVGSADITNLKGSKFEVEVSGVGGLKLAGEVDDLQAEVSGVGGLEAADLKAKTGNVKVTGVGSAKVNVTDNLTARCSGVGGIQYKAGPKLDSKTEGIGGISSYN